MDREKIIGVINKISAIAKDVFGTLRTSDSKDILCEKICNIATLTNNLNKIVPANIYTMYDEFFDGFVQLSNNCKKYESLAKNMQVYEGSLQLFIECLDNIICTLNEEYLHCVCCDYEGVFGQNEAGWLMCPNCKSDNYERNIISFLISGQISLATEGFTVINLEHSDNIKNWINYYSPQVCYLEGDLEFAKTQSGNIIISKDVVELEKYYTHQIEFGDQGSIFVLTKNIDESFDFSWKWEIDKELCENGPLVSVVLPSYNHAKFVEEAILSVINQSYKNIEFLIADDGSTDGSQEILKKYEKYYAKSMYFEDNSGNRMSELKQCVTGKYVAIMHSDDVWHKDKIAIQVEYMEKNPECGTCLTWSRNVDQDGNSLPDQTFIQPNRSREEWMRFFWENGNALCNPSALTKSELFYNKIWQGMVGRQLPDFFKWVDMIQHHSIHIVAKELTFMRRYRLENLENTSIESKENSLATHIEMGINWPIFLRNMDDEFFVNTFIDYFIRKDASGRLELLCEKYFLLLNHLSPLVQSGAFAFFNENYIEIKDILASKYSYGIREYRNDARTKGLMDLLKGIAY